MNFVLQSPLLQHLAAVKIVTALCCQRDAYDLREGLKEEKVKSKVSVLPLPETCKKELQNLLTPIGMEITAWCRYHNGEKKTAQFLDILLGNKLRWTMLGAVDYAKTAELMVKDERLDVESRYEIACLNCLEDEARKLIQDISIKRRREYFKEVFYSKEHRVLLGYFTCVLGDNQMSRLKRLLRARGWRDGSINLYIFQMVLCKSNRATCQYFFNKLDRVEKSQVLVGRFRHGEFPTCDLLYYLSLMKEHQQRRMFQERISDLLMFLLWWPMQSLFMDTAEWGWRFMNENQRAEVLRCIADKISDGFEDYDYSQLFAECWRLSPVDYKRYFLDNVSYFNSLLQTKREEVVKVILNEVSPFQFKIYFYQISDVLNDESAISDAALLKCKQTALLQSSNDIEDAEKRLRSEYLSRLVDLVMEKRMKCREKFRNIA